MEIISPRNNKFLKAIPIANVHKTAIARRDYMLFVFIRILCICYLFENYVIFMLCETDYVFSTYSNIFEYFDMWNYSNIFEYIRIYVFGKITYCTYIWIYLQYVIIMCSHIRIIQIYSNMFLLFHIYLDKIFGVAQNYLNIRIIFHILENICEKYANIQIFFTYVF